MKIDSKKLAYGFLIICVGITGYLLYDTFKIVTQDDSGDTEAETEEIQLDPGEIVIDFNDYGIEEKTNVSLLQQVEEGVNVLYLYEDEVMCEEGVFDYSNQGLLAVIRFSGVSGEYLIENVSVFKRTIEGNSTEISSVPSTSSELNTEETESGLKGSLKFVWEERLIEGEFDAGVCELE